MSSLAGSFLVARPILQDPHFRQAVILLLQHGAEGALGLVVNRSAMGEGLPFPVFAGGPCESQGIFMLHGYPEWGNSSGLPVSELAPGIYLGDASCLQRASDTEAEQSQRFRILSGYAGWGPGQLESELGEGAWAVVPATGEILFDTPAEDLWYLLMPPTIPEPSLN